MNNSMTENRRFFAASLRGGLFMRSRWMKISTLALGLAMGSGAVAVPGEDGDVVLAATGSPASVILNSYTPLAADVAANATTFSVGDIGELSLPPCPTGPGDACGTAFTSGGLGNALAPGDLLMIYQPQETDSGAITTTTLDNSFGAVSDLGSAGLYEFVYVSSISGSNITIVTTLAGSGINGTAGSSCTGLKNGYDGGTSGSGRAMVIRVPQLRSLSVADGRIVTAPAWDGSRGGVVALQVSRLPDDSGGVLSFSGTGRIDVSALGFRGGSDLNDNETTGGVHNTAFAYSACPNGARKGESVFGWSGIDNAGACDSGATGLHATRGLGRGAIANGGGGGNGHNAAGGGGANGGSLAAWTGGGVPDPIYLTAWQRERDAVSVISAAGGPIVVDTGSPPALVNSSGGGRGGYTWTNGILNPLLFGPQVTGVADCGSPGNVWGSDCRANVGGVGGRPLNRGTGAVGTGGLGASGTDRLYFGGGGGAGDRNNSRTSSGGSGGGLVFVMTYEVAAASASPRLLANGAPGSTVNAGAGGSNDAPGGGGAGGTVVLTVSRFIDDSVAMHARGGAGGNHTWDSNFTTESEGGGGGGSGGVIAVRSSAGFGTRIVDGAFNGESDSTAMNAAGQVFRPNGGTRGAVGEAILGPARDADVFRCLVGQCSNPSATECTNFTTPVTNAWFASERTENGIRVRFATAAEVANAGFWLEGAIAADAARGTKVSPFIPAKSDDPASPRLYEVELADPRLSRFWLVDVSADGVATRRGPYEVGASDGQRPEARVYDWTQADQDAQRARAVLSSDSAYLTVTQAGMHRVTHEALLAAGVNLSGTPKDEVAVWSRSGPVPRAVRGPAVFGAGSVVEFHGEPALDLYSRSERYLLGRRSKPGDVIDIPVVEVSWSGARGVSVAKASAAHLPPRWFYDLLSPSGSPWYQYDLTATNGPVGRSLSIQVDQPSSSNGTLVLKLYGGVDLTESTTPDHHVRLLLNGTEVASRRFDGITLQEFRVPVSNVAAGGNMVRVELPFDTGFDVDQVVIVSAEIEYETQAQVRNGVFTGRGLGTVATLDDRVFANGSGDAVLDCQPVAPTQPNTPNCIPLNFQMTQVAIGGRTANQTIWMISPGSVRELRAAPDVGLMGRSADSPATRFEVADRSTLPTAQVEAAPALSALPSGAVDYLVISHPVFMDAMAPLLAHRQAQGLRTAMVDVVQLYRQYTAGNAHPDAIRAFMREHAATLGLRYLVLAGGANYNSVGLLPASNATLSHIPTPYLPANRLVRFAPADAVYGDLTGDYLAEVSVGRLPVRTVAEAQEAVRKLIAYEAQPASGRILLVSGGQDQANGLNFRNAVTAFAGTLPNAWLQSRIDVDVMGAASARDALFAGLATGASVISYTGHSAPAQWGFEPLLTAGQVGALPNNPNQPLLLQFGCWTTYFLSPVTQTMSNAWMLSAGKGASSVFGSTVLLDQPNHDRMAAALGPRLVAGQRLGNAIDAARAELADDMSMFTGNEVLIGITLLGDPATVIR